VRQDFYDANPRISHDLMFAMIELLEDAKDGARFKQALGVSSMALATSQQYEPVREMVRELDLKLQ
jgi:phosphonate transport system substrate-binding protein